jgi:hypothetical protein
MKTRMGLFKKGQSYSELPISRPTNAITIDRAVLLRSLEDEQKSAAKDKVDVSLKLTQSSSSSPSSSSSSSSAGASLSVPKEAKTSLESLLSPRGGVPSSTSSEDFAQFNPKLSRDNSKKEKKKEKKGSGKKEKGVEKEKEKKGSGGKKEKKEKKEKASKKSEGGKSGGSPLTVKYVPPPPSAPPEWAKELPTPMEHNRFVLEISPNDKHLLKTSLKELGMPNFHFIQ